MSGVMRLSDDELVKLANAAKVFQVESGKKWIESLERAQCDLFPLEKRYSKGSLYALSSKLKSHIMVNTKGMSYSDIVHISEVIKPEEPVVVKPQEVIQENVILNSFTFGGKISELASLLAKQFEDMLTVEMEKAFNNAIGTVERKFEDKLKEARKASGVTKTQLPKVMVLGVMGDVAHTLCNEYGDMLDLRFYKNEENMGLVRSQAKHCDYVILMTKFINHNHQEAVREHTGLIFCSGGVSQMKDTLLSLACK